MIYFIGAGPGAADLITVKGKELLEKADLIIYAGSLVNPELLKYAKPECVIMDSAKCISACCFTCDCMNIAALSGFTPTASQSSNISMQFDFTRLVSA